MEQQTQQDDLSQVRVHATWRSLVKLIWEAIKANKMLVVWVYVIGFAHAFFSKAVILLAKPFLEVLGVDEKAEDPAPEPAEPQGWWEQVALDLQQWIEESFRSGAIFVRDLIGLEFTGDLAEVEKKTLIVGIAAAATLLGICGAFTIYGVNVLARYFAVKIIVDLRDKVAGHLLQLPLRFFGKRRMGDLISTVTNDTSVMSRAFMLAADNAVVDPLLLMFNFVLVLVYAPDLWWIFALMVPLMAAPMVRVGRKVRKSSSRSLAALGDSTESMNQMLSGIKTVKAFQLEEQRNAEFAENNARYLERTRRMLGQKGFSQGAVHFCYSLAFGALVVLMGFLVLNKQCEPSVLPIIVLAFSTSYTQIKRLCRAFNVLMESTGALDGVEALLRVNPDTAARDVGVEIQELRGEVAFDNVSFAYDDEPVLRNVSFHAKPGQKVALVGPSGAGKSTALDLLARFHDPIGGKVLIDGQDLHDIKLSSYRKHMAMVSQDSFLFNTSLFQNILYGRPGASRDDVIAAAKLAQIHDFIESLPEGYETQVGERGSRLSGGQLQRITIARAIIRDPSLLILDEATSALDSESEEAVQTALNNLMRGCTSFIIAHRLSTVRDADMILVMDEGRVVESGTHEELTARKGLYSRLSELQNL